MSATENQIDPKHIESWARFKHAYMECSNEIQKGIDAMLEIIDNESTDPDDRALAIATVSDALYPHFHEGILGRDFEKSEAIAAQKEQEVREVVDEMNREEQAFADRLAMLMKEHGVNQVQLAERSGVGQPAISNMLKRQCRPQSRTIWKFAKVFGVDPEDLWPAFFDKGD